MYRFVCAATILMAAFLFAFPAYAQVSLTATIEAQEPKVVKVPTGILKTEDDLLCTLRWDSYPNNTNPNATAYQIQWGIQGQGYSNLASSGGRIWQIQPLDPGTVYNASVRAVDRWGRASAWSQSITFQSDSTRVDAIRALCTVPGGFFDDGNVPAGKPDALLWNFATNPYCDPAKAMWFVNAQDHQHIALSTGSNDRSQTVIRPRAAKLDLSDGLTRTIYLDMDTSPDGRNTWYLDLQPDGIPQVDITNRATTFLTDTYKGPVKNAIRFTQVANTFAVQLTSGVDGSQLKPVVCDLTLIKGADFRAGNNIRKPFKILISKTQIQAYVRGWDGVWYPIFTKVDAITKKVIDTPVLVAALNPSLAGGNLIADKYIVQNNVFAYNSLKNGLTAWLWHYDNFGFDAPAGAAPNPIIYDYKTQKTLGLEYSYGNAPSFTIKIPDAVQDWPARLYYTIAKPNGNGSSFKSAVNTTVSVNGQKFPFGVTDDEVESRYIDLPAGCVVQGDNSIGFQFFPNGNQFLRGYSGVLNVHIEMTAPDAAAAAGVPYTPHCAVYGGCPAMPVFDLGPDTTIATVSWKDPLKTPIGQNYYGYQQRATSTVKGVLALTVQLGNTNSLSTNGKPVGIDRFDLYAWSADATHSAFVYNPKDATMVLPRVIGTYKVSSDTTSGGGQYKLTFDTAQLGNGLHELFVMGYTAAGVPGVASYFERTVVPFDAATWAGYEPFKCDVQNP